MTQGKYEEIKAKVEAMIARNKEIIVANEKILKEYK